MAKKIDVPEGAWNESSPSFSRALEEGNILFFPTTPFPFERADLEFLLQQKQGNSKGRKNISYKPDRDRVYNHESSNPVERAQLHEVLKRYSKAATAFLGKVLPTYAPHWRLDYASFRPFQEQGRPLRLRARNDLLHVDAFPTRPLHGARILRFFTNINPKEGRRWITSEPFETLAKRFGGKGGLSFPRGVDFSWKGKIGCKAKKFLRSCGVKLPLRSPYDDFMLRLHHFMKENEAFQRDCPKDAWEFPPGSCWAVFTDQVSHAALSGQYALEQTFIVPQKGLLFPDRSPLCILERLTGEDMVDPRLLPAGTLSIYS